MGDHDHSLPEESLALSEQREYLSGTFGIQIPSRFIRQKQIRFHRQRPGYGTRCC